MHRTEQISTSGLEWQGLKVRLPGRRRRWARRRGGRWRGARRRGEG